MSQPTAPRPAASVVARDHDDGLIVIDLDSGLCFTLNATGRAIWRGIEAGQDAERIAADLAGTYDIDAATAERDVRALLDELGRAGLLAAA